MIPVKKQPQRSCSGCREKKDKSQLVRVVRSPEGEISLDRTGKKNGRGAYICKSAKCLKLARKAKRFERAFSGQLPAEVYAVLEGEVCDVE